MATTNVTRPQVVQHFDFIASATPMQVCDAVQRCIEKADKHTAEFLVIAFGALRPDKQSLDALIIDLIGSTILHRAPQLQGLIEVASNESTQAIYGQFLTDQRQRLGLN